MRKELLIFIACLCAVMAQAGPIGRSAALDRARAFLQDKGRSISQSAAPAARAPRKGVAQGEASSYYVFNADGGRGFVIVSGDDRTVPVLGYSLSGNFCPDSIPDNMKAWLQGYADQIEALDAAGMETGTGSAPGSGGPRLAMSPQPIAPLLSSEWNQYEPYSDICPVYGATGERCVTGCVATAMAQMMYYHRWPAATAAEIPAYTSRTLGYSVSAIPAGTPIDWDNMLGIYGYGSYTDAQGRAVAELMLYCGAAMEMDYNSWRNGGSGAYTSQMASALRNYFDYDPNVYCAERRNYTISQWNALMLEELANNRPVVYGGQSSGGGHCFVIDGYDGQALFHVNWGWGGMSDSYFAISVLNPYNNSGAGASSSQDGFAMDQLAIIGAQPSNAPEPMEPTDDNNRLSTYDFAADGNVVSCAMYNMTDREAAFDVGYAFYSIANDATVYYRLFTTEQLPYSYGYTGISFDVSAIDASGISGGLPAGRYKIYPVSRISGSTEWCHDINTDIQYALVVIGTDGSISVEQHPIVSLEASAFWFSDTPTKGVAQTITVTVDNHADEFNGTLYLFAQAESASAPAYVMRTGTAIPEGSSADVEMFFTPALDEDYHLWVATDCTISGNQYVIDYDKVIGDTIMHMGEAPPAPDLAIMGLRFYDIPVVNKPLRVVAAVMNNGSDFNAPLYIYTADETLFEEGYVNLETQVVANIPAGEIADVEFYVTPAGVGQNYLLLSTTPDLSGMISGIYSYEAGAFDVSFTLHDDPVAGHGLSATFTVDNYGDDFNGVMHAFYAHVSDYGNGRYTKAGDSAVSLASGGSFDFDISFTPAKAGTYACWLSTSEDGSTNDVGGIMYVEVAEAAEPVLGLRISSYVLPDDPRIDVGQTISATILNDGDDYSGTLYVLAAEGDGVLSVIKSVDADIAAGDSIEIEFTVTPTMPATWHFLFKADDHFIDILEMEVPPVSALLGDIDGNGRLDVTDVTLLSKYISDSNAAGLLIGNADINGDGRINVIDVVELAWLILKQ